MNARDEKPLARREGVLTEWVGSELVVVDAVKNKAHCLNESSAFVWDRCDGTSTVAEIARCVEERWGHSDGWAVAQVALHQLVAAKLLVGRPRLESGMNRRDFLSKAALAAAAIPVIASVLAPTPAHAASCIPKGGPCGPGSPPCCTGFCNAQAGKCVGPGP